MLDEILTYKRMEVEKRKAEIGVEAVLAKAMGTPQPRDFSGAVSRPGHLNLIAEIKYRSPSAGAIREGPPPAEIAKIYDLELDPENVGEPWPSWMTISYDVCWSRPEMSALRRWLKCTQERN